MPPKYTSTKDLPWIPAPSTAFTSALLAKKPKFADLPLRHGIRTAWDYFGRSDELGTVNFLTPDIIAAAAREEIKDGTVVTLNLPLQLPTHPSFHRIAVKHEIKDLWPGTPVNDDIITWNTQSGTQTDGLRHFGCLEGKCFYNGVLATEVVPGSLQIGDPLEIANQDIKIGIHTWAQHSVTGRGVLLDMVSYYKNNGGQQYDAWTTHAVSLKDMKACAKAQGTTFKHGDNLLIRMGWTERYYNSTAEEKLAVAVGGNEHFAGIENTDEMAAFIWDEGLASISSDVPALESWPPAPGEKYLHETILAGFGCPIGEFFELELLAETCAAKKRYTFFYSSTLLNILGGCASTANAQAIF